MKKNATLDLIRYFILCAGIFPVTNACAQMPENASLPEAKTSYYLGTEVGTFTNPQIPEDRHQYLTMRTVNPLQSSIVEHSYIIKETCAQDYGIITLAIDPVPSPAPFVVVVPSDVNPLRRVTGSGFFHGPAWRWTRMEATFNASGFSVVDTNDISEGQITGDKKNYSEADHKLFLSSKAVLKEISVDEFQKILESLKKKDSCIKRP